MDFLAIMVVSSRSVLVPSLVRSALATNERSVEQIKAKPYTEKNAGRLNKPKAKYAVLSQWVATNGTRWPLPDEIKLLIKESRLSKVDLYGFFFLQKSRSNILLLPFRLNDETCKSHG